MKRKIGYDLDGVICSNRKLSGTSYRKMNGQQRKEYIRQKIEHYKNAKLLGISLPKKFYIITGRTEKYEGITRSWLKKNNINPLELYMNTEGGLAQDHIKHKVKKIKELGLTRYYEDSLRIYKGLKKECLNTDIVLVLVVGALNE